jgi:hypothetical protein
MFIVLGAADVLAEAAAADEEVAADVAGAAALLLLLLLLLLLQAARPRAAAAKAATAALRRTDRVAGKLGTAKLLCARSLGGGLAARPVGRVPARSTGIFIASRGLPCNGLMSATRSLSLMGSVSVSSSGVKS